MDYKNERANKNSGMVTETIGKPIVTKMEHFPYIFGASGPKLYKPIFGGHIMEDKNRPKATGFCLPKTDVEGLEKLKVTMGAASRSEALRRVLAEKFEAVKNQEAPVRA